MLASFLNPATREVSFKMSTFKLSAAVDNSLPSPPFIAVSGLPNFRDLGGSKIRSQPGKHIRTGLIYRSGEPSQIREEGIAKVTELGIKKAFDLRSNPEIASAKRAGYGGETEWPGCERHFVPVFKETDYSPESVALRFRHYASDGTEGFTVAYTEIIETAPSSYSVILRQILDHPDVPILFHCTAGKDRTGVLGALILSLCGVDDETIASEYALTEIGLSQEWKELVIAHLMHNSELKNNPAGAWNLISAKRENMAAFLKVFHEKFGGSECYLIDKCGFTKEEVDKIRSNLIVDDA